MKTLQLFGEQSRQVFNELNTCASKNAVFGYNKKAGRSVPVVSKHKMAENFHRIDRHWPKIGLNPNFVGIQTAHGPGQICIRDFMGKLSSGGQVPAFLKSHTCRAKNMKINFLLLK